MFDVRAVSAKIRDTRMKKNLTQSNLADELGVSFQAVSNWERGNSLPDISKYEDLCRVLGVDLEYLLGMEAETQTVEKWIGREKGEADVSITVGEIASVAPILPPQKLKEVVHENSQKGGAELEELMELAPFLDRQTMDELTENVKAGDISELLEVAPFVSKERLGELTEQFLKGRAEGEKLSVEDVIGLAPFLRRGILGRLVEDVKVDAFEKLIELAPFVSKDTLDGLTRQVAPSDIKELIELAPFASRGRLDELTMLLKNKEEISAQEVLELAPFVSKWAIEKLLGKIHVENMKMIIEFAPFVSKETLKDLIRKVAG